MRFLKIKIQRERKEGSTHYGYPQPYYDMLDIKIGPIYEGGIPENLQAIWDRATKDKGDEFVLVGVSNDIKTAIDSPDIEELDELSFKDIGSSWTKQAEKITDQDKVLSIIAKSVIGKPLTQIEKDALDLNNPEPGINLSKSFNQTVDEELEREI